MQPFKICIGPTIRIGRESWCLPYAGFFFINTCFPGIQCNCLAKPGLLKHRNLFFFLNKLYCVVGVWLIHWYFSASISGMLFSGDTLGRLGSLGAHG